MATRAGPAPWSHEDYWQWRDSYKATSARSFGQKGVQWSLSSGFRKKPDDWAKQPGHGKTKTVKLANGRSVRVPDADFEDFIGHHASQSSDPFSDIGKYIDEAWENVTERVDGVGHITQIQYAPTHQVMWVEFETDGAIVVYFRVPAAVYGQLYHLAKNGDKDAEGQFVLGKRFWDIIRIRGQRKGGRYRYEYAVEGEYQPKGTKISREASKLKQELAKDIGTKEAVDENEMLDWINSFKGHLVGNARQQYDALPKDFNARYKFMRAHGLDVDLDDED